jgi:hypothetical protein
LVKKREILKQRKLDAALAQENRSQSAENSAVKSFGLSLTGSQPKSLFSHLGPSSLGGSSLAQSNNLCASQNRAKIKAAAVLSARNLKTPEDKKKDILSRVNKSMVPEQQKNQKKNPEEENKVFMGKKMSKIDAKGKNIFLKKIKEIFFANNDLKIRHKKRFFARKIGPIESEFFEFIFEGFKFIFGQS